MRYADAQRTLAPPAGAGNPRRARPHRVTSGLKSITRTYLWQDAAAAIRGAIVAGELTAGERISEAQLAEQLGVSRAPIRDAMHVLAYEGLIEPRNGATYVVGYADEDIHRLYRLRGSLEAFAVRETLGRLPAEALADLGAQVRAMRRAAAESDAGGVHPSRLGLPPRPVSCSGRPLAARRVGNPGRDSGGHALVHRSLRESCLWRPWWDGTRPCWRASRPAAPALLLQAGGAVCYRRRPCWCTCSTARRAGGAADRGGGDGAQPSGYVPRERWR